MDTGKITKKSKAEELIRNNQRIFKCPVCGGKMAMENHSSLVCDNSHCFDLSKTGYLNLLASRGSVLYSKELFEARRQVCLNGFYDPLIEELGKIALNHCDSIGIKNPAILDAGCGEGSHLSGLSGRLSGALKCSMFGTDIAKEGIKTASKNDEDILWIVADSAKLPFENSSFHVILNILAPANYQEFERLLAPDGIIVKVAPGKSYLEELRLLIFKSNSYSSDRVVDLFSNKLEIISKQSLKYRFAVDKAVLPQLLKMTPLTWGAELNGIGKPEIPSVTVDLTIISGKKSTAF